MAKEIKIKVNEKLYSKLLLKSKEIGMNSVEEYISFIINESTGTQKDIEHDSDEEEIKERLKDLGYL